MQEFGTNERTNDRQAWGCDEQISLKGRFNFLFIVKQSNFICLFFQLISTFSNSFLSCTKNAQKCQIRTGVSPTELCTNMYVIEVVKQTRNE